MTRMKNAADTVNTSIIHRFHIRERKLGSKKKELFVKTYT